MNFPGPIQVPTGVANSNGERGITGTMYVEFLPSCSFMNVVAA